MLLCTYTAGANACDSGSRADWGNSGVENSVQGHHPGSAWAASGNVDELLARECQRDAHQLFDLVPLHAPLLLILTFTVGIVV